jgi:hypothetical protein
MYLTRGGSVARGLVHTCLHEKVKAKEVEKVGGG